MKNIKAWIIAAGLGGVLVVGAPSPVYSAVTVTGQTTVLSFPPPSVTNDANLNGSQGYLFREGGYRLPTAQAVDVLGANLAPVGPLSPMGNYLVNSLDDVDRWRGNIAGGTPFSSYFLHIDSINDEVANGFSGSVTFDRDILGVILLHDRSDGMGGQYNLLGDTDPTLGSPFTTYPGRSSNAQDFDLRTRSGDPPGSGSAIDSVRVSQDLNTLIFAADNVASLDQLRILVANGNVVVNPNLPPEIIDLPSITVPGPTNEFDVDPFDFSSPITQQILNEGFDDCTQGERCEIFSNSFEQFKENELLSSFMRIETNGAVEGIDFGADDIDDPYSYYALTHDDVFVDWINVEVRRDVYEEVTNTYFLELPIGDYQKDGIVDEADLAVWEATFGNQGLTPFSGADGNGDGTINGADYLIWQQQFGQRSGAIAASAATIPEPATLYLCGLAFFMVGWSRSL